VEVHPNLGAEKLYPLLLDFCDAFGVEKCPKPSTIERLIVDMGGLRTFPQKVSHFGKVRRANRRKVLRKPIFEDLRAFLLLHHADVPV